LAEVEKVNARLEDAVLITSRALSEVSGHPAGEQDRVDLPHGELHRENPEVAGDREELLTTLTPQTA
jgi:hypothetical protein